MTWDEGRKRPIKDLSAEDIRSMMMSAPDEIIPALRDLLVFKHYAT